MAHVGIRAWGLGCVWHAWSRFSRLGAQAHGSLGFRHQISEMLKSPSFVFEGFALRGGQLNPKPPKP